MKKNIHIVYDNNQWKIKKENSERATKIFNTKNEAIDYSKKVAKDTLVELIIHNKNGRISNKNTYGPDPCPPKDKKH